MSVQGMIVVDLLGVAFIVWITNLVRTGKLHTGYGLLWLGASVTVVLLVSIPPLMNLVTRVVGAIFPASALSLIAFAFVFAVLIMFSVRLSALTRRQTRLAQAFALSELSLEEDSSGDEPRSSAEPVKKNETTSDA